MSAAAIIVAAGSGTRAGGDVAKQWRMLAGRRVLDRSVDAFRAAPGIGPIVIVLSPGDMDQAAGLSGVRCVTGGADRPASVRAGLEALADQPPRHVLIHDAARPLVSQPVIAAVLERLQTADGAAPGLPVSDALWRGRSGLVAAAQDRTGLYRAQTPQGFCYRAIMDAHRGHPGGAADDVQIARESGIDVAIVPGDERNLKLTYPDDFLRAEAMLGMETDFRVGTGYDVHRFCPGDHVMLCGVRVPHDRGLKGHSDADVAMHAATDAICGALAEGDIGQHFPPGDPQWKDAASAHFLRHAAKLAAGRGFRISNIDVTLICESPKIGPHAIAMKQKMADLLTIDPGRVSVKATTSERLGFTGRKEGIAAMASATLVCP